MKTFRPLPILTVLGLLSARTLVGGADTTQAESADPLSLGSDLFVDDATLRAFVDRARSNIEVHKAGIVSSNLILTEEEAVEFWPVYREYTHELNKLKDERLALIQDYLRKYRDQISNVDGEKIALKALDIEERRTKLKRTCLKALLEVIPANKAARFFQIEQQLEDIIDVQIAAALPLIT